MEPIPASTDSQYSLRLFMLPTRDSHVRLTFVKPAPLKRSWTFLSSARAKDVRTTSRIWGRQRAIASARKPQIGARSGYEITHTDALPPGRSTRRNSERPRAGFEKTAGQADKRGRRSSRFETAVPARRRRSEGNECRLRAEPRFAPFPEIYPRRLRHRRGRSPAITRRQPRRC